MTSGIIVLDKKEGFTSMASDSYIKKLLGTKKVGHHGTLDPFATGVLPIYVGDALKIVRYADEFDKKYECVVRFGMRTDTQDKEGERIGGRYPTDEEIGLMLTDDFKAIRDAFVSASKLTEQTPPIYSAKKINGQKAYELARKGETVELASHPITIHELRVDDIYVAVSSDNKTTVEAKIMVHCSKGTYIRSICDYVGELTGFGAHAAALRRISCGNFDISMSYTEEQLKAMVEASDFSFMLNRNLGVAHLLKIELNETQAADLKLGRKIDARPFAGTIDLSDYETRYAAFYGDELIAIVYSGTDEKKRKLLRIERMLASND